MQFPALHYKEYINKQIFPERETEYENQSFQGVCSQLNSQSEDCIDLNTCNERYTIESQQPSNIKDITENFKENERKETISNFDNISPIEESKESFKEKSEVLNCEVKKILNPEELITQQAHNFEREETFFLNESFLSEYESEWESRSNSPYYIELDQGTIVAMVGEEIESIHLELLTIGNEINKTLEIIHPLWRRSMTEIEQLNNSREKNVNKEELDINNSNYKNQNCILMNERMKTEEKNSSWKPKIYEQKHIGEEENWEEVGNFIETNENKSSGNSEKTCYNGVEHINTNISNNVEVQLTYKTNHECNHSKKETDFTTEQIDEVKNNLREKEEYYETSFDNNALESIVGENNHLGKLTENESTELRKLCSRLVELNEKRKQLICSADEVLRKYAEENEKWEGNEKREECYHCHKKFSIITRRHHCRRCGKLCCAECSKFFGKKQTNLFEFGKHIIKATNKNDVRSLLRSNKAKSEYTARMASDNINEEILAFCKTYVEKNNNPNAEEIKNKSKFKEHSLLANSLNKEIAVEEKRKKDKLCQGYYQQNNDASAIEVEEEKFIEELILNYKKNTCASRQRQECKWVRICSVCYNNCLRARKTEILKRVHNANECVLDDGLYYFFVLTEEELWSMKLLVNKPESFRKHLELQSKAIVEQAVDYVKQIPAYSSGVISAIINTSPQMIQTVRNLSVYSANKLYHKANDLISSHWK